MIASMEGHLKVVKLLVDKRAKIDETDKVSQAMIVVCSTIVYEAFNSMV